MEDALESKWHIALLLTSHSTNTVTWLHPTANCKAGRKQNPDRDLCDQLQHCATEEGENEVFWTAFSLC